MLTYTLTFTSGRQKLVDSMGGVGSVYINWKHRGIGQGLMYRVEIVPMWVTSSSTRGTVRLFLQLDGTLVSDRPYTTDPHNVFNSNKEASDALARFIAAGCPGLALENLSARKAATKAANSAKKAAKAAGILRGMNLEDLIALRDVVDAAIAKKTPKKK